MDSIGKPKQDAEIKVEDLPQDILIKIMELLSPRQRLRAMCTCKALSESRYKMWTSIEINNVTTPQMPSVSAFLSRVGSQSGEILKHISLPSVYSWQIQSAVTGCLQYQPFKALQSLDFGILDYSDTSQSPCWGIGLQDLESLGSLTNLKILRANYTDESNATPLTLETLSSLVQLSILSLMFRFRGQETINIRLSPKLEGLTQLRRLELQDCRLIVNRVLQRLALRLTHMDLGIINPDKKGFKVPQLTSASLTSTKGNGKLLYPLFETEKLQSLSLNGTVHKGPEYASLPALTHLVWNESFGLYAWQIQSLAAASSLKSLETDEYIPAAQGSISEFYDYCPRLEQLTIYNLLETNFMAGFFGFQCMERLERLEIVFDTDECGENVYVCLTEFELPNLTYLELKPCFFMDPLDHDRLETLKIESDQHTSRMPAVHLGELPALKTLHLAVRIEKQKDVDALASSLSGLTSVENVYLRNTSTKKKPQMSIVQPLLSAAECWGKLEKLELVEKKADVALQRETVQRVKHLGIVCKSLTISDSLPVMSFCIQTDAIGANSSSLRSLNALEGAIVQQPWIHVDRRKGIRAPKKQVMQAYRHDFLLPPRDWIPQSDELKAIMMERLSHV